MRGGGTLGRLGCWFSACLARSASDCGLRFGGRSVFSFDGSSHKGGAEGRFLDGTGVGRAGIPGALGDPANGRWFLAVGVPSSGPRPQPPAVKEALPVVTFGSSVVFHLNGQKVKVFHVENAHTDGDAIIYFADANVVHMGDNFFNGMYPFIDLNSGGSVKGMIDCAAKIL